MKKLIRITSVPLSLEKLLGRQLTFMNRHFAVTAISSDREHLRAVAEELQVPYFAVEMTRAITPLKDLKAIWQLYRYFRREKPEIVHTHTPKAGLVGMVAAWLARVPVRLHTVAGLPLLEATGAKRSLLNWVEKITYFFCTRVYPNSEAMKDIIINEKFCAAEKLKVLGNGSSNGIDLDHFNSSHFTINEKTQLRAQLGIGADDFVFIFVGRLVRDKGVNELVKAFKNIQTARKLKLLLVGPLEQHLDPLSADTLAAIDQNPDIITTGYADDVRPFLAVSDCLVLPSYREGFPNAVLQAGAMNLPAIVSDINGCNEIISDGVNGLIVPPKDEVALKSAMEMMANDAKLYNRLRSAAAAGVAPYEQQKIWNALLAEYGELTGGRLVVD